MNARAALEVLWWKEVRQLLPLFLTIPILGLLLLGLEMLVGAPRGVITTTVLVLLGMPGLFAAGAGALLVGQEKDQRTIQWLTSLPIDPRRIVRIKLAATLPALVALWMLSGLLYFAADPPVDAIRMQHLAWWTWPLHSLYLLLAGFALAWATKSAFAGLLGIVPVAILPYLAAYTIDSVLPLADGALNKPTDLTLTVCQVLGCGIALWATDALGRRSLAAEPAEATSSRWMPAVRKRFVTQAKQAGYGRIQAPMPALVWQFVLQSRVALAATSGMLGLAAAGFVSGAAETPRGGLLVLSNAAAFLAVTWLGVLVFQSDSVAGRIRFLADRGVSPGITWFTRHAVPTAIVSTFFIVTLLLVAVTGAGGVAFDLRNAVVAASAASAAAVLLLIYSLGQWTGQLLTSPILSALIAPFIVIAAVAYGQFTVWSLGTPWWVAALLLIVPSVATLTMTRRWMDRRFGLGYWGGHAGLLSIVILMPWVPLLITAARLPSVPAAVLKEMDETAQRSPGIFAPQELVLAKMETAEQRFDSQLDRWHSELNDIEQQLAEYRGPVGMNSIRVLDRLQGIGVLTSLSLESAADEDSAAEELNRIRDIYRRSVEMLTEIVPRMRSHPRLIEQDGADIIEIGLLKELTADRARERLGSDLYSRAARMLADRRGRNLARQRAVAMSLRQFELDQRTGHPTTVGGHTFPDLDQTAGTVRGALLNRGRVRPAMVDLYELARGGPEAATPQRLSRIARAWEAPESLYGIGPQGEFSRIDDVRTSLLPPLYDGRLRPARQWHAGWERQAEQLVRE